MLKIPTLQFYITNVCNLTCRGCNRFNNLGLKGFQRWKDNESEYEKWAKRITANKITIIGGEPALNADLENYVANIRRLWPEPNVMIQTNGTYFRPEFRTYWDKYQVSWTISLHDEATAKQISDTWGEDVFKIASFVFQQNALIDKGDHYIVHNSNIGKAFRACSMKYDAMFLDGKLYKCPTVALLPDVVKQKPVRLDERQKDIMLSYTPLTADCSTVDLQRFIDQRNDPIANCEFCPAVPKWHTALGELKENLPKPKFDEYK